jgi:hypothetical protein
VIKYEIAYPEQESVFKKYAGKAERTMLEKLKTIDAITPRRMCVVCVHGSAGI